MSWRELVDPAAVQAARGATPDDPYSRRPPFQSRRRFDAVKRFPAAKKGGLVDLDHRTLADCPVCSEQVYRAELLGGHLRQPEFKSEMILLDTPYVLPIDQRTWPPADLSEYYIYVEDDLVTPATAADQLGPLKFFRRHSCGSSP